MLSYDPEVWIHQPSAEGSQSPTAPPADAPPSGHLIPDPTDPVTRQADPQEEELEPLATSILAYSLDDDDFSSPPPEPDVPGVPSLPVPRVQPDATEGEEDSPPEVMQPPLPEPAAVMELLEASADFPSAPREEEEEEEAEGMPAGPVHEAPEEPLLAPAEIKVSQAPPSTHGECAWVGA
jgi:hypothetical protein